MSEKQKRREFLVKGLTVGVSLIMVDIGFPMCLCAALAIDKPQETSPECGKQKDIEDLAYCGFDCEKECYVYKATQENDLKVKEEISKRWKDLFGVTIKPEDVACDGCRSKDGRLGYHCSSVCDVRKCALSREIKSCAVCDDFPSCEKELWKNWPEMYQRTKKYYKRLN